MKALQLVIITMVLVFFSSLIKAEEPDKHVHMMHLDGVRGDLLKQMMLNNQLPNLQEVFLKGQGNFEVSTVDKSETMKVTPSYLSSKLDTEVVGWWQWSRDNFQFRNFWIDPVEVLNYGLGLEFPLYPTVFDVLANDKQNMVAGFHLFRRGVPFDNYARAYAEGVDAVFNETYFKQALASMDNTINILNRNIDAGRCDEGKTKVPVLSTSLLASVDEFAHADGIISKDNKGEACFTRKKSKPTNDKDTDIRAKDPVEPMFMMIEEQAKGLQKTKMSESFKNYFTKVEWTNPGFFKKNPLKKEPTKVCIKLPKLKGYFEDNAPKGTSIGTQTEGYATPRQALAMIFMDIQFGRLVKDLKEKKMYDKTMFVIFGDHGMADTKKIMVDPKNKYFNPETNKGSLSTPFITDLNNKMNLNTTTGQRGVGSDSTEALAKNAVIGIDDANLPPELSFPHKNKEWQSEEVKAKVASAQVWANKFFDQIKPILEGSVKEKYSQQYWFLYYLADFVKQKVDNTIEGKLNSGMQMAEPYKGKAIDILTKLYLHGDKEYVEAERQGLRKFYDEHVRLVYGGGARNNAELFIPSPDKNSFSWSKRPSYDQIMNYKPENSSKTLIESVKENPGVGLIFVRKNNGSLDSKKPLSGPMDIEVMDRFNNKGQITINKDEKTGRLTYSYKLVQGKDPLGYVQDGLKLPQGGDYNDWNDLSVKNKQYYHNAVAGMGSILYSNNPAFGDITLMRSQGWDFGENNGGHGGIHREEKLTFTMVAGPGVSSGKLMSKTDDGKVTNPTLLDISPTVLNYLGYGEKALTEFSRDGFPEYWRNWNKSQKMDIVNHYGNMDEIVKQLDNAGTGPIDLSGFKPALQELLRFMPKDIPGILPDYEHTQEDGNQMILK